ncbi:hypothetical protein V8F06_003675 [Rhypophila decipiens]
MYSASNGDATHVEKEQVAEEEATAAPPTHTVNDVSEGQETGQPEDTERQQVILDLEKPFSWLQPHPIFAIILVGKEESPFGIHIDFLAAKSAYYREYFKMNDPITIENIVRLPDTDPVVFGYAQNFMYTGQVFSEVDSLPSYEILISLWRLGHELGIDGLCDAALEAMIEYRRITSHIPATPLLVQAWKDTPEDSTIRKLLLSWAAEYMRSSDSRTEFARSLPQEVLSELVVAMSSLEATPTPTVQDIHAPVLPAPPISETPNTDLTTGQRRNASHFDAVEPDVAARPNKRQRNSDVVPNGAATVSVNTKAAGRKPNARASLPSGSGTKGGGKRKSNAALAGTIDGQPFSTNQRLNFCADLLTRMLSGPGFWTRLVGPFKEPVNPELDVCPDYFEKVKKPMDLGTMKAKMDRHEYADENEFLADMNQIFTNCYTYWSQDKPIWAACEKLQKTFEDKYSQMNKWISKMEGDEGN